MCTGGLSAIAVAPARPGDRDGPAVFCGGGDGLVRRLAGYDMRWRLEASAQVEGGVCSLSFADGGNELLVGTDSGRTYRLLADDLGQGAQQPLSMAHVGEPTCVAFGSRPDVFATAADDGELIVWDLSDYAAIATTKQTNQSRGQSSSTSRSGGREERAPSTRAARFGERPASNENKQAAICTRVDFFEFGF